MFGMGSEQAKQRRRARSEHRLLLGVLCCFIVGAALRLWGFATAGSLWLDELFIANNLRELSWPELFGPLNHGQNAPVGWLLLLKFLTSLVGDREWVLRLPSLLASLLALPLTWELGKRAVGERWACLPLLLVSLSPLVIWQGLQAKPYACDLWVALTLQVLAWRARESTGSLLALGAAGWVAIWLSMPAIFILAGIGVVLAREAVGQEWRRVGYLAGIGLLWLVSFGINYLYLLRPRRQPGWLYEYWSAGLLARPLELGESLAWIRRVLAAAIEDPLGVIGLGGIALLPLVLAGLWFLFTWPRRGGSAAGSWRGELAALGLCLLPLFFTLLAASLRFYPFASRLVHFLVPSLAIAMTFGLRRLAAHFQPGSPWRGPSRLVAGSLAALILMPVLFFCLGWVPRGGLPIAAETKALFQALEESRREEDLVVVDHLASHAWSYYGVGSSARVILVPSAWTDEDRARGLRRALESSGRQHVSQRVWVAISRVSREGDQGFREALAGDLRERDLSLPRSYRWLVDGKRAWTSLERFSRAIPVRLRLAEEQAFRGAVLWRLERVPGDSRPPRRPRSVVEQPVQK